MCWTLSIRAVSFAAHLTLDTETPPGPAKALNAPDALVLDADAPSESAPALCAPELLVLDVNEPSELAEAPLAPDPCVLDVNAPAGLAEALLLPPPVKRDLGADARGLVSDLLLDLSGWDRARRLSENASRTTTGASDMGLQMIAGCAALAFTGKVIPSTSTQQTRSW